ncbi:MAG: G5 domain-containing protein [Anaerolineales bacterium]|nr:G5 domain-containing protein [Anaerolineales bacterium]
MHKTRLYLLIVLALCLGACAPLAGDAGTLRVTILADGGSRAVSLPAGSSVRSALEAAGVQLGALDRSEPPSFTILQGGQQVRVLRVHEEFETEQTPLPFTSRTLPNEALPVGEQRLIQNGVNGLQEATYRLLYEDGELVSRTLVGSVVLAQPVDEIIMIGAQAPFSAVSLPGRLAFLSAGNAWVLEGSSGLRRAVAATGDLDGRIFEVSPDGRWLLFSRDSAESQAINELWLASLDEGPLTLIDLEVRNMVHYAGWRPGREYQIAFSTVDPSPNPPGWQARNDLQLLDISAAGQPGTPQVALVARGDGFYAWWGSSYAWSPSGDRLAFARPDAVGTVNLATRDLDAWFDLPAYQTGSDWAWIPGLSWLDEESFYFVRYNFSPPGFALVLAGPDGVRPIAADVGLFAMPQTEPGGAQVAYLRAFLPTQGEISGYQLMVATPEGVSMALFPPEGAAGLTPQRVAWSPSAEQGPLVAFIYEGDLWVVNVLSGQAQQLTGDGLVSALSWR